MGSVYVHSEAERAEILANEDLINGTENFDGINAAISIESTIHKLESIRDQLDAEAEAFLDGYSIEGAQDIADHAGDFLQDLASRVLYGEDAYGLLAALNAKQIIDNKKLQAKLNSNGSKSKLAQLIKNKVVDSLTVPELGNIIVKELTQGSAKIEVSEAGAHIVELGHLFDVSVITTSLRKKGEAAVTDAIFQKGKALNVKGVYSKMIKDLLRSSDISDVQKTEQAVDQFCTKLQNEMISTYPNVIHFIWSDPNKIEKMIKDFIKKLKPALQKKLKNTNLFDKSVVAGEIGESVRETITKTANSVIITLQMGNLSEEKGVPKMNQELKNFGVKDTLIQMESFHAAGKQSQTDLILVNTKTKKIARAQSKNHITSYFTSNGANNEIQNFRWKVEDSANLSYFISSLSKTNLGINLNDVDLSNINNALANNLWFSKYGSAKPGSYRNKRGIIKESYNPPDILPSFEGAMEKVLAGQITNLLGVTISVNNYNMVSNASNMFYILNGRMKKSSELVQQAIDQLQENLVKTQTDNVARLINVSIKSGSIPSPKSVGDPSFLPAKLRTGSDSYGEQVGQQIIDGLKISVSLGTSITSLAKTSLMI